MKRRGYRFGVEWIALNDSAGDGDALDPESAAHLVSTALLADLFCKKQIDVGRDIVRFRKKENARRAEGAR